MRHSGKMGSCRPSVAERFIRITGCLAACLTLFISGANGSKRPNILMVVADDHSYPDVSILGAEFVNTPAFDRIANEGVLFEHAFASAPSCSPSRASILLGKPFYLTESVSMNHGFWQDHMIPFPKLLRDSGYKIGSTGKVWGPGQFVFEDMENGAGKIYNDKRLTPPSNGLSSIDYAGNFQEFLNEREENQPFYFWFGPSEPHRILEYGIGKRMGMDIDKVRVPAYFPDVQEVRNDLLDYGFEIQWYDRHLGEMLDLLELYGELDNTVVIITSDHGMAFPRAKTTVYDAGLRVPLAIKWPQEIQPSRKVTDFVILYDLAPTLLEIAGVDVPEDMLGKSMHKQLFSSKSGWIDPTRDHVIAGLERHGGIRSGGPDYPSRTYRNSEYLFIKNYEPDHPPAGPHPGVTWPRNGPVGGYGYVDGSPTKTAIYKLREKYPEPFLLSFEKRPMYELYDVEKDPDQVNNLAYLDEYNQVVKELERTMEATLKANGDPRLNGDAEHFEIIREKILKKTQGGPPL